jgi:protein-S-isoprenylcysteine O-methyltransferase Ste14
MIQYLFLASIILEILYLLLFILTIKRQDFRFWPPPSAHSWQFFSAWMAASLVVVGFFFIGLLDFNSGFLAAWIRFPAGLVLHIIGTVLGFWALITFDLQATIGLGNKLITWGPYRYSRNPQYIADILHILGFMVLTNSWRAWIIGTLGLVLNLIAPLTEESWLEEKFGEAYMKYKEQVPRFIC